MFSSLYAGLTGLIGFSKGLDVVSNNVANMNTTGFKSSQLQFKDIFYQYRLAGENSGNNSSLQVGGGVDTSSTSLRMNQGEFRATGNDLDIAVDGNGFFILKSDDDKTYYTRSGRFEVGDDGFVIDSLNKHRLSGMTASGSLVDIDLTGYRTNPPAATTEIEFSNYLSVDDTRHEINDVEIIDSLGKTHKINIIFIHDIDTKTIWRVQVEDSDGTIISSSENNEIRFQGNGAPLETYNTVTFDYSPDGADTQTIILDFGKPGSLGSAYQFSGADSKLEISSKNGHTLGALTKLAIDEDGYIVAEYSNEEKVKTERIGLAWFEALQSLEQTGGNLFTNNTVEQPKFGFAKEGVMGKLLPGNVELSNVELTEQFTDMVILQRGYQASSQIISTTNEMIQQLFDMKAGR